MDRFNRWRTLCVSLLLLLSVCSLVGAGNERGRSQESSAKSRTEQVTEVGGGAVDGDGVQSSDGASPTETGDLGSHEPTNGSRVPSDGLHEQTEGSREPTEGSHEPQVGVKEEEEKRKEKPSRPPRVTFIPELSER